MTGLIDLDDEIEAVLPDSAWHEFTKAQLDAAGVTIYDIRDTLKYKGRALGIVVIIDIIDKHYAFDLRCRLIA